jgi:hypothetical protein
MNRDPHTWEKVKRSREWVGNCFGDLADQPFVEALCFADGSQAAASAGVQVQSYGYLLRPRMLVHETLHSHRSEFFPIGEHNDHIISLRCTATQSA